MATTTPTSCFGMPKVTRKAPTASAPLVGRTSTDRADSTVSFGSAGGSSTRRTASDPMRVDASFASSSVNPMATMTRPWSVAYSRGPVAASSFCSLRFLRSDWMRSLATWRRTLPSGVPSGSSRTIWICSKRLPWIVRAVSLALTTASSSDDPVISCTSVWARASMRLNASSSTVRAITVERATETASTTTSRMVPDADRDPGADRPPGRHQQHDAHDERSGAADPVRRGGLLHEGEVLGGRDQDQRQPEQPAGTPVGAPAEGAQCQQGDAHAAEDDDGRLPGVGEQGAVQEGGHRHRDEAGDEHAARPAAGPHQVGTGHDDGRARHRDQEGGELDREPELGGSGGHLAGEGRGALPASPWRRANGPSRPGSGLGWGRPARSKQASGRQVIACNRTARPPPTVVPLLRTAPSAGCGLVRSRLAQGEGVAPLQTARAPAGRRRRSRRPGSAARRRHATGPPPGWRGGRGTPWPPPGGR